MDTEELMLLAPEKAIAALSWESIEFLFNPRCIEELFCRTSFEWMEENIAPLERLMEAGEMPLRFRTDAFYEVYRMLNKERFYRQLKKLHAAQDWRKLRGL